jgi:hypothetical protein
METTVNEDELRNILARKGKLKQIILILNTNQETKLTKTKQTYTRRQYISSPHQRLTDNQHWGSLSSEQQEKHKKLLTSQETSTSMEEVCNYQSISLQKGNKKEHEPLTTQHEVDMKTIEEHNKKTYI